MSNNLFVFAIYDKEVGRIQAPFLADGYISGIRQFMLGMKAVPAEVRSSLHLIELTHIEYDESTVEDNYFRVASGDAFEEWLAQHSVGDNSKSKSSKSKKVGSK